MLGLCCNETCSVLTNYVNGYDDGDNNGNEDGKDEQIANSGSGYDGNIFDLITTYWSRGGGSCNNGDGTAAAAHYVSPRRTIYLPYKDHIKDMPYISLSITGLQDPQTYS